MNRTTSGTDVVMTTAQQTLTSVLFLALPTCYWSPT